MTLWTVAWQAPLSMGFSKQKYWSGPPPGDLPDPGIKPVSLALAGGFFFFFLTSSVTWEATWEAYNSHCTNVEL